jgi:hypothetical protein
MAHGREVTLLDPGLCLDRGISSLSRCLHENKTVSIKKNTTLWEGIANGPEIF